MRGRSGEHFDRVLLALFVAAAAGLTVLLAWRGNWAGVIWP